MSKPIIAVDADDTLFDEVSAVRQFMNDIYGFKHTAEDYRVPGEHAHYFQDIWNLSPVETDKCYEAFVTSEYKLNMNPVPGALAVLTELKQQYDLVIVTARERRSKDLTHNALALHYPELFKDVHFAPLWGGDQGATKAIICNEIGAKYLIDDSYDHCKLAAETGVAGLLFGEYGWSDTKPLLSNMFRLRTWCEVEMFFNKV